jgi:hypothetical protein
LPRGQPFVVNFFKFFGLILISDESGLRFLRSNYHFYSRILSGFYVFLRGRVEYFTSKLSHANQKRLAANQFALRKGNDANASATFL